MNRYVYIYIYNINIPRSPGPTPHPPNGILPILQIKSGDSHRFRAALGRDPRNCRRFRRVRVAILVSVVILGRSGVAIFVTVVVSVGCWSSWTRTWQLSQVLGRSGSPSLEASLYTKAHFHPSERGVGFEAVRTPSRLLRGLCRARSWALCTA